MLDPLQIQQGLAAKRDLFHTEQAERRQELTTLYQTLGHWNYRSAAELMAAVANIDWPGVWPTAEQDRRPPVIPFDHQWENHRQARHWARSVLEGVTTFAADGSQISATRDISIPVGVVQVGWFENRHCQSGAYDKGLSVEVLAPPELTGTESGFADSEIEWRRFQGEAAQAERFMTAQAGSDQALAFFDSSFILSFIQHMPLPRQQAYVAQVERLLSVSEASGVPLVGYVDASYADDLGSLLARLAGQGERAGLSDAALLGSALQAWGSRSRLYRCARSDRVLPGVIDKYYRRVLLSYLQVSGGGLPARLELPEWVLAADRQDWVFDVVRAECVVGLGYPYTLETADAVAVLTGPDRQRFFGLFQQFAEREQLPLRFSRKSTSKQRRR